MKTAISVPDDVFESAEALAKRLGMSRSRLFATALAEFVAKHRTARITERLDAVYGPAGEPPDPAIERAQRQRLRKTEW